MSDDSQQLSDDELEKAKLNTDTGQLGWEELARHFARGVVIRIDETLDLVQVAQTLLKDDSTQVEQWQQSGQLARASDDDARRWNKESSEFWAIVIAPWVIVQEIKKPVEAKTPTDSKHLH